MTAYQPAAFARFGDVAVRLSVELGRTEMPLRDVLMLGEGSTVALDRLTDELLDVTANGRVIARGEVVAEKGRFALRIVSLVGEDGQDVPPSGEVAAPVAPAAFGEPVVPSDDTL
jgi:flagellar motor switch protein FliN